MPVKVVRVAIPEGGEVTLETAKSPGRLLKGLKLGPAGWRHPEEGGRLAGPTAETSVKAPLHPVRIGMIGYLRAQRFVEVIYQPITEVRSEAGIGSFEADFHPEVDVQVRVASPKTARAAGRPLPDPGFESTYQAAFVNYDDSLDFRPAAGDAQLPASPASLPAPGSPGAAFMASTTPVYRVFVKDRGIYRMSWDYLVGASGVAPGLAGTDPRTFKITSKGVEIPIRVVTAAPSSFAPGDYIEFFGEGMLDEPEVILNFDFDTIGQPLVQDIRQANDFTDESVYFLYAEPGTRSRIADLPAAPGGQTPVTRFGETIHREYDNRFVPEGSDDPFFQGPSVVSNSGTHIPDPNQPDCGYTNGGVELMTNYLRPGVASNDPRYCQACDLALPDVVNIPDPATIRVRMRGSTNDLNVNPDHMTVIQLGTTASRSTTMCWEGESLVVQTLAVPQSALTTGDGIFIGQPGLGTTPAVEALYVDWIEVDYQRALRLAGNELVSKLDNASGTYQLSGFATSVPDDVVVYDVSRTVAGSAVPAPRRLTAATIAGPPGNVSITFTLSNDPDVPAGVTRRLASAGAGGFRTPLRVTEVTGEDLSLTTHAADMLVITTPSVVDMAPGSAFMDYLSHRSSSSGLSVKVVFMRDIYDHFSNGVETPQAIRDFLLYAWQSWRGPSGTSAPPSYALLVGDISADYKNNLALPAWTNQVPTFIMYWPGPVLDYYASDTFLSAFVGPDQLPDIHLGRVAVRTPAEAETVFQKLLDYDTNPPTGSWRSTGIYIADRGKDGAETADFEEIQSEAASHFAPPFSGMQLFYSDPNYQVNPPADTRLDPSKWRTDYVNRANSGAAFTSYLGHGSFNVWGLDGLLDISHMALLSQSQKPTFLVNENCLAGGFHALSIESLGEAFMKAPGKGAVAVLAPAGLSFSTVTLPLNTALYGDLFGLYKERRFGVIGTNMKLSLGFALPDMQAYVLMGDPAQRLILPGPRPPANFQAATGLDARVDLSWSPGPDGGQVRIYRADVPNGTYTLINAPASPGTTFTDTTAINGQVYFYRAVSVDLAGPFEGGITNSNADCNYFNPPASGPSCRWAKPLNPNPPPTPSGVRVTNPGLGDRLRMSWTPPPVPDLFQYTIRYGTTQGGPYPGIVDVPAPAAETEVAGLITGTTYYMILTATNTSGRTSLPSPELSGRPDIFDGVPAPGMVVDLEVLRAPDPNSIEIRWTPPANDIYGGPVTLESLSLYRGTSPYFIPDTANRIAHLTNVAASSHVDPGAWTAPGDYYYLVVATDPSGISSGAGRQLPAGISDLGLSVTGGMLTMSWTPVTVDVDGFPTLVDHYEVFSDTQPVGRARLQTINPMAPSVAGPPFSTSIPPGTFVYYSVLTVDVRGNRSPF